MTSSMAVNKYMATNTC